MSNPLQLWERATSEDVLHYARRDNSTLTIDFCNTIYKRSLWELERVYLAVWGKTLKTYGLPSPPDDPHTTDQLCQEILCEASSIPDDLAQLVVGKEPLLMSDQQRAYDAILNHINGQMGGLIFLEKRTSIISYWPKMALASSGISATLLDRGHTAHSALKLPLNLVLCTQAPVCDISKGTGGIEVFQQCILVVWDECTTANKQVSRLWTWRARSPSWEVSTFF
ncbi:uncharacterized protein [Macrobrachium rosenbergii]|uniref:uncharacterized protein isoform X1 n=1 Tax=Macrobrachium rosenbergii TaxID=79674 RepID=UPI0034D3A44F